MSIIRISLMSRVCPSCLANRRRLQRSHVGMVNMNHLNNGCFCFVVAQMFVMVDYVSG